MDTSTLRNRLDGAVKSYCPVGLSFDYSWAEDNDALQATVYCAIFRGYDNRFGFRYVVNRRFMPMTKEELFVYAFRLAPDKFIHEAAKPKTGELDELKLIESTFKEAGKGEFFDRQMDMWREFEIILHYAGMQFRFEADRWIRDEAKKERLPNTN